MDLRYSLQFRKIPLPVPGLNHINPVHTFFCLWLFPLFPPIDAYVFYVFSFLQFFYKKNCVYCLSLPCVLHIPCCRHLTHWIDHRHTGCRVKAKFFPVFQSPISSSVWNPNTLSCTLYLVSVCCCQTSRCSRDGTWEAILILAWSNWAGVQGLLSR